ncbi:MAG: response regulator [candidate division Zixibacteria bacterium]|nr:response regulator [candidate division Zixibacteria bacterium]
MPKKIRLLLLQDNKYHALLIKRELADKLPQCIVATFQSAEFARDELRRNVYNIALIDYNPSWGEGLDYIKRLHREMPTLKIILLASNDTNHLSENALESGATDFVLKEDDFQKGLACLIEKLISPVAHKIKFKTARKKSDSKEEKEIIELTVSTLAHEINNPLMTILGETELLLHNGYRLAPEIDRKIRVIEESAQRIRSALASLSGLTEPSLKETPTGTFIDLKKS